METNQQNNSKSKKDYSKIKNVTNMQIDRSSPECEPNFYSSSVMTGTESNEFLQSLMN